MANTVELILRGSDQTSKAIASSVKGLQGMESVVGSISRSLAGLVSVGALGGLARSAIQLGSDLDDASKKFGVSASELSKLQYVAKLSGVEFGDLGMAFKFLSKSISEAQDPTNTQAAAFRLLGVNTKDANGVLKSTSQIFDEVADAFSKLEDGANKTRLALALFGRSGENILPVFEKGAAGINALKKEAVDFGAALSEEEIKNLDAYGDAIDKIGMVAKSTAGKIIVNLVAAVDALAESFGRALGGDVSSNIKTGKIADILVPNPDKKKAGSIAEKTGTKKDDKDDAYYKSAKARLDFEENLNKEISDITMKFYKDEEEAAEKRYEEDKKFSEMEAANWGAVAEARIQADEEAALAASEMMKTQTEDSDLYKMAWMDATNAVADAMMSLYSGMQGWISSSLQGLITGTMAVSDVLKNLGKMMLSVITDYIAKWVVSRLFMAAMGKTFQAAEIAAAVVAGTAVAAAWAPAAAMVSLATFGSNSVPAMEGIAATYALTQALAIPALAEGGIVNRPTLALIGEAGPEAVVPLGKGRGGVTQLMVDGRVLTEWINDRIGDGRIVLRPA